METPESQSMEGQAALQREVHSVGEATREWTVGHAALSARGVTMAGISHAQAGFAFETKGWAFGQLLICFGGEGQVRENDKWRRCGRGMVYVNPPGVPHAYRQVGTGPWKLCWLVYHPPFDQTPLAGLENASVLHTNPNQLRAAIIGFRRESIGRADAAVLRTWADLIHLLGMRVTQGNRGAGRLWRVWDAVNADPGRHWSVADLAGLIGISEEHLRRLAHDQHGRSPMEHVTYLRMRRAAVLLRTTDLKIDTIAEDVAYADRFGFSAAFRRHFDVSPAQYRREQEDDLIRGAVTQPPADGPAEGQEAEFSKLARAPKRRPRRPRNTRPPTPGV